MTAVRRFSPPAWLVFLLVVSNLLFVPVGLELLERIRRSDDEGKG